MQNNVAAPNLNMGIEQGLMQTRFGNGRDGNMSFPSGLSGSQPNPTSVSRPRNTINVPTYPAPNEFDSMWDMGDWIFAKTDTNHIKHTYDIKLIRYIMYQSAISYHLDIINYITQKGSVPGLFDMGSDTSDELQRRMKKAKTADYSFLSTLESIELNLALAGVMVGPADPSTQVGTIDISEQITYTGIAKQLPLLIKGDGFMPNMFNEDILPGQNLYMMIKPQIPQRMYANPRMQTWQVSSDIKDWHLIPDLVFYTALGGRQPPYCSSMTELLYSRDCKQPPLTDRAYIEWSYDARKKINSANEKPTIGNLKQAILWKIGKAYNKESPLNQISSRSLPKPQEPLPFQDFSSFKKIQFEVDIRKIMANS